MKYAMVIDLRKCIGCYGCQIFCKAENATPRGVLWSRVLLYEVGKYPNVKKVPLPVLCMQCEDAPCVTVCPSGASVKRSNGIVTIDPKKCTGCLNCLVACPYGARQVYDRIGDHFPGQGFIPYEEMGYKRHALGLVGKCDFCLSRIEKGLKPACVENCMTKARYFGDLDDPSSDVSQLVRSDGVFQIHPGFPPKAECGEPDARTSVYYLPR